MAQEEQQQPVYVFADKIDVIVNAKSLGQMNVAGSNIGVMEIQPGTTQPANNIATSCSSYQDPSRESRQPSEVPSGPGWCQLSENIYMYNRQPLKENTTVYKGKQRFAGEWRDVAIKLIQYSDKNFEEVKLHLKLEEHPNIIRMFHAGEIQGIFPQIYIVMELCPKTLRDFIEENKEKPIDFDQRFSFAKQIIAGVAFIHKKQILHRDIKLENILLSPNDYIRVADFGLSKQLQDGHSGAKLSFQGAGSDGYRAPEMLVDKPEASFRSDSFSLGVVLAMLFTDGRHPFGCNPKYWRINIMDNKPFDLSGIQEMEFDEMYVSKIYQLLDLITQALDNNRLNRPTPDQMLQHSFFTEPIDAENQNITAKEERVKFLTGELKKPFHVIGFEKSARLLESLKRLRGTADLQILLQIAECHLHLMSDKKDLSIAKVMAFISASQPSSWDVLEEAGNYYGNEHYVRAMILYKIAHDLHKEEKQKSKSSAYEELKWIRYRIYDIFWAIKPLVKSCGRASEIAMKYGITYMTDMLHELQQVPDVTIEVRAEWELACLIDIVGINAHFGEYRKAIEFGEQGSATMDAQLSEAASRYKLYGRLLHVIGDAYRESGDLTKAKECYGKAIESKTKAVDYENDGKRREDIDKTKVILKITRGQM